jgi:murein DD-endopeptidase MepM/ murein hydrolase activator NlpD
MIPAVGSVTSPSAETMDPKAVAAKVQAMFMELMLKAMEESVGAEDGLFSSSSSSEIYRGMFREQLGAALGSKVGGSLMDELEKSMKKSMEKVLNQSPQLDHPESEEPMPTQSISAWSGAAAAVASSPIGGLPVAGIVTSEVGWRKDPFSGAMAFHKGTDIAAPQGTAIRAVASGTVVESGAKGEYGNAVVIKTDDGRRMLYGHNAENFVQAGDRVQEGETIASVGATGKATGPHVHFEVSD